jgi:hypothetical protein
MPHFTPYFTPGNKANMKLLLNKSLIMQNHIYDTNLNSNEIYDYLTKDFICNCIKAKANNIKQGWNDPSQTENARYSQILSSTLGGRTTFGNLNRPIYLNELGGWEGQPGGSPKPLRNKF